METQHYDKEEVFRLIIEKRLNFKAFLKYAHERGMSKNYAKVLFFRVKKQYKNLKTIEIPFVEAPKKG